MMGESSKIIWSALKDALGSPLVGYSDDDDVKVEVLVTVDALGNGSAVLEAMIEQLRCSSPRREGAHSVYFLTVTLDSVTTDSGG